MIGADETKAFRANAEQLVAGLKKAFPWVDISPKLHILLFHAPDDLERFRSLGLYGEQALEAWHGHYKQKANQYTNPSELHSAANLVRVKALAREAVD